jgi:multiple sugar transport system substrate-binding protein
MIEEYEKKNPNIDIVIADYIDTADYANSLTTAAAGGKLPDVIMLQNIPNGLSNEWLMDITEFTSNDEDWNKVSKPVIESAQSGNGTYAVPAGQFLAGYFVNKDLFEKDYDIFE